MSLIQPFVLGPDDLKLFGIWILQSKKLFLIRTQDIPKVLNWDQRHHVEFIFLIWSRDKLSAYKYCISVSKIRTFLPMIC